MIYVIYLSSFLHKFGRVWGILRFWVPDHNISCQNLESQLQAFLHFAIFDAKTITIVVVLLCRQAGSTNAFGNLRMAEIADIWRIIADMIVRFGPLGVCKAMRLVHKMFVEPGLVHW